MAENSLIEWTHHTFNPWVGCERVSPGCKNCYAATWANRTGNAHLWNGERRRTTVSNWRQPIKWQARCAAAGIRERVFCASLADVFDNAVPDEWRRDLFKLIAQCNHLDWLLLTKRIGNVKAMLRTQGIALPANVWLGSTMVTQAEVDRDLSKLLDVPARVRFISAEPLLEHLLLPEDLPPDSLHWVIVGGESGGNSRPFHVEWARTLVAQCGWFNIAPFVKQLGAQPYDVSARLREWPGFTGNPKSNDNGDAVRVRLVDRKGGDMAEWPEALRKRVFPAVLR